MKQTCLNNIYIITTTMNQTSIIPDFDNYNISTQTLIISTNIDIDCEKFYECIECVKMNKSPLNTKNKMVVDIEEKIDEGDIVFAQYKKLYKGTNFKKISEKYFLNSVTIIMKIEQKFINIKVSNKGKLQITGCNQYHYAVSIMKYFWSLVQNKQDIWLFKNEQNNNFRSIIVPVMCNINFSIGFQIDRSSLHNIINNKTEYISILELSDGYVGLNIKIPSKKEFLEDILIDEFIFDGEWKQSKTKFMEYINTLTIKEQRKKMSKCYMNTFLVFYSGKVIFSGGISYINRRNAYEVFMDIVTKYRSEIIN